MWQKNAAFILSLIGVLSAVLFFNQVLANGDNSVLSVQRVDQFDNTKYSLTLDDPEGLSEFLINKADGSFIWGGEPKNGTPPCPTSITSDTVTLSPEDFPLSGYVIDCENADVQNSVQASMPPLLEGVISGYKFYDANGNGGARDDDDPGIRGWEIFLIGEDDTETDEDEEGGVGYYAFEDLLDGTYTVCENTYGNWTQTYPAEGTAGAVSCDEGEGYAPWGWEVTIENGEIINNLEFFDFGNTPKLGDISVVKFNDRNGDGVKDEGEPGVEGIEFRLNDNGLADDFLQQLYSWFLPEDFNRFTTTGENGIAEWDRRLPAGTYEIEEQESEGWIRTTDGEQEIELNSGVKETEEVEFGNRRPALIVYKYDENEDVIPGWEICLYKTLDEPYFDENEEVWVVGELTEVECQETLGESDEEDPGPFHGAAVFSSENLEPGEWYLIDEEERDGWRLENWDWDGLEEIEVTNQNLGQVLIRLGNNLFFDDAQDSTLYLYNRDIGGDIVALKYIDENLGIVVRGWEICLREFDEEIGEAGPVIGECKETDENGMVQWQNVLPGTYILDEEEREVWGWQQQGFSTGEFNNAEWQEFGPEGAGQVMVSLDDDGHAEIHFLNWVNDALPPQSAFEDPMEHHVIDTEIVSLELSGTSVDTPPIIGGEDEILGSSGIHDATLSVRQLAGPEAVADYPSSSFFDIFHRIDCRDLPEEIPIELVSLNLVSVDPTTVVWDTEVDLGRRGPGIYCFEARATDNAGNPERTGYAGPLAYVPTPKISEESTSEVQETSFTVNWTTAHAATSRVIYDTVSHGDEDLGDTPNYGYVFSTPETDTDPKVAFHSVTVNGLTPGTTYYYRAVSRGSPEAVGPEGSTTTGNAISSPESGSNTSSGGSGGGGINNFSIGIHGPASRGSAGGEVLGASTGPEGEVLEATSITLEDQIDAIQAEIERLRALAISLTKQLIELFEAQLTALKAQLAAQGS